MSSIQSLKKQLRSIRSTQKLTKAMRTVSAAKFSALNARFAGYSEYGRQCRSVLDLFRADFLQAAGAQSADAPPLYVVMASNRGLCGGFNSQLLSFAARNIGDARDARVIACGAKAISYFERAHVELAGRVCLSDVPEYAEAAALLDDILLLRNEGKVGEVSVIYPEYVNMLEQNPSKYELFPEKTPEPDSAGDSVLFIPDREATLGAIAGTVFRSVLYGLALETALGAQAATMMTMRSAYNSAAEFCLRLEGEINRMRQSTVTADVIETASGTLNIK